MYCHKMVSDLVKIKPELEANDQSQPNSQAGFARKLKPLEEVTCYKVISYRNKHWIVFIFIPYIYIIVN